MPQPRNARRPRPAGPSLPVVSVAKLEEGMALVERMVAEHTATFIEHGKTYKDQHRDGSRRPLTAVETAQIAAGLGTSIANAQAQIEEAGLTAYDEPGSGEVLMAAGIATGAAFMGTVQRLTALIEMSDDDLEAACEADQLDEALDLVVVTWRRLPVEEIRKRAVRALEHFSKAAGFESGKAIALAGRAIWQGLWQAMGHLVPSESASSLLSPPSDGPDETSSTTSPTATPST
jgi:hypothetical protein